MPDCAKLHPSLANACSDLKLDNVLLCEKGHAHLTDFNLAVKYEEGKPMKSTAGTMVGVREDTERVTQYIMHSPKTGLYCTGNPQKRRLLQLH